MMSFLTDCDNCNKRCCPNYNPYKLPKNYGEIMARKALSNVKEKVQNELDAEEELISKTKQKKGELKKVIDKLHEDNDYYMNKCKYLQQELNEMNFWKEKYLALQKDYLDLKSKHDLLINENDDCEALDSSSIEEICDALERVYGKEEKNCKYHFKIKEYGSCYSLDKIVFNDKSSIATIWFNDMVSNSNMLSKEKAYEIIQNIKKHLEEVE